MQSLKVRHSHNTPSVPVMPSSINDLSYDAYNLNKATTAPRNRTASQKPEASLQYFSCDLWGPVHVPSPYGLRYCLLVIDHHTNCMWVRFLKSKDETCSKLETILPDARYTHAQYHSQLHAFAPFIKLDLDSVIEAGDTQLKLFTTCAGKQDRLLTLGPLYFAFQDLLASWARVSSTRYTYRHT
jgi:hypothetical protein